MTTRKAPASLQYSTGPSINWARALRSFIEQGMAALCVDYDRRCVAAQGLRSATREAIDHLAEDLPDLLPGVFRRLNGSNACTQ
jgi:hypothetical protein